MACDGSEVSYSEYDPLGNVIGTTFGGDGQMMFKLPDLGGRAPVGSGTSPIGKTGDVAIEPQKNPTRNESRAVTVSHIIAAAPEHPEPFVAEIRAFAFGGKHIPEGWTPCDGRTMPISSNTALFSLLGTNFGGDGKANFGLPDLRMKAAIGANNAFPVGSTWGKLTSGKNGEPFLAITWCIATGHAIMPPRA